MLRSSTIATFFCSIVTVVACAILAPSATRAQSPSVPPTYQATYSLLNNYLSNFNTTLNASGPGTNQTLLTAALPDADGNSGPQMLNPGYMAEVTAELLELKAMGVQCVLLEVGFPMLYEPFFENPTQYQQAVSFYQEVSAAIRAQGMKIAVENNILWSSLNESGSNWNPTPFYATLTWQQYLAGRAQTAVTIAQVIQPDFMVLLEEPNDEANTSGQVNVGTPAGAAALVSGSIAALQQAGYNQIKLGAGVGSSQPGFQNFISALTALPLNFIDMHIYPVNGNYLPNALTIASMAAAAGMPLSITECWLHKVSDSELGVLTQDQIRARNPFDFWAPLDAYFIQTMENLASHTNMAFLDIFESRYFWSYLAYSQVQSLTPPNILSLETLQANVANVNCQYTSTGLAYYNTIVSPPDTLVPSPPTNLVANSDAESINWQAATDNVGIAGYYVYRNGILVATTPTTFYQDSGLPQATSFVYTVQAFDLAGNVSWPWLSPTVTLVTPNKPLPTEPTNLIATAVSSEKVKLLWTPSTDKAGIAYYNVYLGSDPSVLQPVGRATTAFFYSFPLSPGTTYYYAVQAVDPHGLESGLSAPVQVNTFPLPTLGGPPAPVTLSSTKITLTWPAASANVPIHFYYVLRGTTATTLSQIANVITANSYTDTGLTPGATYYYALEAVDTSGDISPLSPAVRAATYITPTTPGSLTAKAASDRTINLTWSPSNASVPIASYVIWRGNSSSGLTKWATTTGTSYSDTGLPAGVTYYYTVQAVDSAGDNSAKAGQVAATTFKVPSTPVVTATAAGSGTISLTWTTSTGNQISSYKVFRDTSLTNLNNDIATQNWWTSLTAPATAYTDTGLTTSTTYYYAVQSEDAGADFSAPSAAVSATTYPAASAPVVTATVKSSSAINLTWTASAGHLPIASYSIYRDNSLANLLNDIAKQNWWAAVKGSASSYTDTGLAPATTYYYAVQSIDNGGNIGVASSAVPASTFPLPTAPVLTANPVSSVKIGLAWTASTGSLPIGSYKIYRDTSLTNLNNDIAQHQIFASVNAPATSYTDKGLAPAATYYYAVQAVDSGGAYSAVSAPVSAVTYPLPGTPTVTARAVSASKVSLTWTAATTGLPLASYIVFRGTSATNLVQVATPKNSSYNDPSVAAGTTYYYAVESVDTAGDISGQSPVVSVQTPTH